MPNRELFPGGAPPDRSELLQYLVHVAGLDTAEARNLASRYSEPSKGGVGGSSDVEWTEDKLRTWVEAQPEMRSLGRTVGQAVASASGVTATEQAAERQRMFEERFEEEESQRVERASRAADEAAQRAGRTRDRFYRASDFVFDSGPAMDPGALAQSMAVGVFTDAAGNPIIDPETGMPTEVNAATLWQAVKGQTFDMGALSIPRAPQRKRTRAGREGADDARVARLDAIATERRRFITPSMAMAMLGSMDDDDIIRLQQQLWEAGLFGETPPSWGIADQPTRTAYMELFGQASLTPNESIDRVLSRLKDEAITRGIAGGGEGSPLEMPSFKPEVASPESLGQMIDDIAQDLLGRFATDEEKTTLIEKLRSREIDTQRQAYDRDVAEATGGGGPGGIDQFMAAIGGLESGGDYGAVNDDTGAAGKFQIMPENWAPWAERAGLGRGAPRTPENQEIVARHVMSEYYQRFGNWRDVAIAWFAGPGAVGAANAERRSDGNITVREYADRIMAAMGQAGGTPSGGQSFAPIETFDPAAEAEAALKAMDPAGWAGSQWADRAAEFYSLLGGVA